MIPTKFLRNLLLPLASPSFVEINVKNQIFSKVGCLVTRNVSASCLKRAVLYFKVMSNSMDFYKGIFLHVIPVRIIVLWLDP